MTPEHDPRGFDERVLFVAPTRQDIDVTLARLSGAELPCFPCDDMAMLALHVAEGAGAVMLTDASLGAPGFASFHAVLGRQPPWSDVPVLMLSHAAEPSAQALAALAQLPNVTLLDEPVSARVIVSAVQGALRARRRQYEIRAQLARREAAEQALRDADRRRDEFLATLAHELRNPLAPLRTALHVLDRMPAGGAPQAAMLHRLMQRQVTRLARLIDELLDLSCIAGGQVALQRERIDLRTIVASALEDSAEVLLAGGHVLQWEPPAESVGVVGDATRLAQVIGNLVHNAAQYTPAGGRIAVTLRREGADALVEVADNGVGIPHEMLEAVFEMFAQLRDTRERRHGGLGVGLSLARSLVELHGGTVRADSPGVGLGSRFAVRLPALADAAPVADAPMPVERAARHLRVLVVDDNIDAAETLAMNLRDDGHEVRAVYDGASALREAEAFAPELVLCDLGMPELDGHAVARRLRADARHAGLVLVALTGWGSDEDRRRTRAAGFDFHLVKPVEPEVLERLIARL